MTTKENVIKESISRIYIRLSQIDSILNANPLGDIIELRKKAQKLLDENKGDSRFDKDFVDKVSDLAK